jgi:ABC-type Mn2+/Zn2+ transport system ATPase subunit
VNSLLNFEQQYNRMKAPYESFRKAISLLVIADPVEDADETPVEIIVESVVLEPSAPKREVEEAKSAHWTDRIDIASEWIMNKMCELFNNKAPPSGYAKVQQEIETDFPLLDKPSWPGLHWTGLWRLSAGVHIIEGPSGGGKSTLINALTGQIEGMHIRGKWQPGNLRKRFAFFYQALKAKMPFTNITVEQLFGNATCDEIEPVARACGIWELLCDLHLRKKIVRELSGGERTRVALAVKCLQARKDPSLIIVLDEPEQGLDPDLAYKVMDNIFRMFKDRIIIVVSHLELSNTKFPWRTFTTVAGGTMTTVARDVQWFKDTAQI